MRRPVGESPPSAAPKPWCMEMPQLLQLALAVGIGGVVPVHLWQLAGRAQRRTAVGRGRVVAAVACDAPGSETPRTTWHARVQFAAAGREFAFTSSYGNSWSRPAVGSGIAVRYDPLDPDNAEEDRGQSPTLVRCLAGCLMAVGVVWILAIVA
jgi:hypothetical protein